MQPETNPSFWPYLQQRFNSLVWSCLDADLHKSALFYAERYFALDQDNHDARHLYATAMLRASQTHSALHLVSLPLDQRCSGCLEIKSKCCSLLGRHRHAREALEESLKDSTYSPSRTFVHASFLLSLIPIEPAASLGQRTTRAFPEEAALHCQSGLNAMKGKLPDHARRSFRLALALNPMLWDAFLGLCSLGEYLSLLTTRLTIMASTTITGSVPEVEELFPSRPPPIRRAQSDESLPPPKQPPSGPVATGAGFFTPDTGNAGNLFRTYRNDHGHPPSRITGSRDSMCVLVRSIEMQCALKSHTAQRMIPSHTHQNTLSSKPIIAPKWRNLKRHDHYLQQTKPGLCPRSCARLVYANAPAKYYSRRLNFPRRPRLQRMTPVRKRHAHARP